MSCRVSVSEVKWLEHKADHQIPSSEIVNSIASYAFMASTGISLPLVYVRIISYVLSLSVAVVAMFHLKL
jgi:hypothetical protein